MEALTEAITKALVEGIPKLVEAVKAGRDLSTINVGDFVSADALEKVKQANAIADDYIENG
jgi:hypothetical protein